MPPARRPAIPSARAPRAGTSAGPAFVGLVCGLAVVVGVLLPWYATNLGPPFSATSASGWDATTVARVTLVLGVVLAGAAAATLLDDRGVIALSERQADALAWTMVVAAAVAAGLVGYRFLVMPEPAEFLSRQFGLYLAAVAAIGGVLSGLGAVATRD
ncbi:hypothetical protein [Miltoncostaea oceani]|uniref:hypothetical protein n=1 Tax=Miltoncostaea oceani TaxID=2843216 RepID=UPI001C3D4D00|nr:hypothetical protein [Miltoncostaea oceani]